jgi:hypothetical protein
VRLAHLLFCTIATECFDRRSSASLHGANQRSDLGLHFSIVSRFLQTRSPPILPSFQTILSQEYHELRKGAFRVPLQRVSLLSRTEFGQRFCGSRCFTFYLRVQPISHPSLSSRVNDHRFISKCGPVSTKNGTFEALLSELDCIVLPWRLCAVQYEQQSLVLQVTTLLLVVCLFSHVLRTPSLLEPCTCRHFAVWTFLMVSESIKKRIFRIMAR